MVMLEVAGLTSVTVNLILSAVLATQPVTLPVLSVDPGTGIATFVTPPTGFVAPLASTTALGVVAKPFTETVNVRTAVVLPVSVVVTTMVRGVAAVML